MTSPAGGRPVGLSSLMRRGTVTELLFLYECTVAEPGQLRPIAERLGLTVQAASHSFRRLAERGLAEFRDGRYRATVRGVAWLHETLGQIGEDLAARTGRLHVIRSCRAIALDDLPAGAMVTLEFVGGLLGARPGGSGPSRGRATGSASRGQLVTIDSLEGIVPLPRGRVHILTLDPARLDDRRVASALRERTAGDGGLLAAPGLEPFHLLSRVTRRPILRFGVAPACREAARVGVDSTVVLLDEEIPRFLEQFGGTDPPALTISRLADEVPGRRSRRSSGRRHPRH